MKLESEARRERNDSDSRSWRIGLFLKVLSFWDPVLVKGKKSSELSKAHVRREKITECETHLHFSVYELADNEIDAFERFDEPLNGFK